MDATIQTKQARYRPKQISDREILPPVALFIDTGAATFADWLTPEQARQLGSALIDVASEVEREAADSEGGVLEAADELVDAADRLDAACGESRR